MTKLSNINALQAAQLAESRLLKDISVSERFQTSRDAVAALVADGAITPDVQNTALRIIDAIRDLYVQLEGALNPTSSIEVQFLDAQLSKLTFTLQGARDRAVGNTKSDSARAYSAERILDIIRGLSPGARDEARAELDNSKNPLAGVLFRAAEAEVGSPPPYRPEPSDNDERDPYSYSNLGSGERGGSADDDTVLADGPFSGEYSGETLATKTEDDRNGN
jgi:hypothetical protein